MRETQAETDRRLLGGGWVDENEHFRAQILFQERARKCKAHRGEDCECQRVLAPFNNYARRYREGRLRSGILYGFFAIVSWLWSYVAHDATGEDKAIHNVGMVVWIFGATAATVFYELRIAALKRRAAEERP